MAKPELKFVGVELYFDDLPAARQFYAAKLGLAISEEQSGHFVKFEGERGFICLERKGSESYPSRDKAVLFFEVADLAGTIASLGRERSCKSSRDGLCSTMPKGTTCCCCKRGSQADATLVPGVCMKSSDREM